MVREIEEGRTVVTEAATSPNQTLTSTRLESSSRTVIHNPGARWTTWEEFGALGKKMPSGIKIGQENE